MDKQIGMRKQPKQRRWPHLVWNIVAGIVALALIALLLTRIQTATVTARRVTPASVASHLAPDFTIHSWAHSGVPSQPVHLAALHGQPVVVNFWASWCDACRAEAPTMEAAWQRYQSQGVTFIGIDVNDTKQDALAFMRQYHITYMNGPDPTGAIVADYGLPGLPVTVFISRQGTITGKHIGEIQAHALDQGIQSLL